MPFEEKRGKLPFVWVDKQKRSLLTETKITPLPLYESTPVTYLL
jgi:hypothetical protein